MKILIIYNPNSGNGSFKNKIDYIKKKFKEYNLNDYLFYASTGPNDITNYIKTNCKNIKYDAILVSGGDGTLNEAINGIMSLDTRPRIAYIPSGTANDVGYMLGMKKNIKKSIKIILQRNIVKMDISKMNDRYFVYTCGCGKFTKVSHSTHSKTKKKLFGKLYYFFEATKEIITNTEMNITIKCNDQVVSGTYFLMLILTGNRVAGISLRRKRSKLNDGKFEVFLFEQKNVTSIFNMTNYVVIGDAYKKGVTRISSNHFEIFSDTDINYNIDGESYGLSSHAVISMEPKAIEIYVSKRSAKKYF